METATEHTNVSSDWVAFERTQSLHEAPAPVVCDERADGALGLKVIYDQLKNLSIPDSDNDEFVPPTQHAIDRFLDIIVSTAYQLMSQRIAVPRGQVIVDYKGGLRIEWWSGRDFCVTLVVGHDENAKSYVFVKLDKQHAGKVNERILPVRLASQLKRLSGIQPSIR